MKMTKSLERVYTLTFVVNILAMKSGEAFSVLKNNIKEIEYSY